MTNDDALEIASERLRVRIAPLGAEMISICHHAAGEVLWQAGPAWPKHAPVLFPIVGELARGELRHDGRSYPLGRHGFARERRFAATRLSDAAAEFVLTDDAETRAHYPFAFRLTIRYAVTDDKLDVLCDVTNPAETPLPASLGLHPAFRWPLPGGADPLAHVITFAHDEPERVRRLRENLLDPRPFPTPIEGDELALRPELFDADAIVLDAPRSTSVRYGVPGATGVPEIEVAWDGFRELGLWSKRGGAFVCIEPWRGFASPAGFDGPFTEKPGLMHLQPGETRRLAMHVRVRL